MTTRAVCNQCGQSLNEEAKFCTECGTEVSAEISQPKCPNPECQVVVEPDDSFCPECGTNLQDITASTKTVPSGGLLQDNNWIVMAIFSGFVNILRNKDYQNLSQFVQEIHNSSFEALSATENQRLVKYFDEFMLSNTVQLSNSGEFKESVQSIIPHYAQELQKLAEEFKTDNAYWQWLQKLIPHNPFLNIGLFDVPPLIHLMMEKKHANQIEPASLQTTKEKYFIEHFTLKKRKAFLDEEGVRIYNGFYPETFKENMISLYERLKSDFARFEKSLDQLQWQDADVIRNIFDPLSHAAYKNSWVDQDPQLKPHTASLDQTQYIVEQILKNDVQVNEYFTFIQKCLDKLSQVLDYLQTNSTQTYHMPFTDPFVLHMENPACVFAVHHRFLTRLYNILGLAWGDTNFQTLSFQDFGYLLDEIKHTSESDFYDALFSGNTTIRELARQ